MGIKRIAFSAFLVMIYVFVCKNGFAENKINIASLIEQADFHWEKTYVDDYGREVFIDIKPIIPHVESIPILIVDKPEYTENDVFNVCDPLATQISCEDFGKQFDYTNRNTNERWSIAIVSMALKNIHIQYENIETKIEKKGNDLESLAGISHCSNEVNRATAFFDGYSLTVQDCIEMANKNLSQFFPQYNLDLDLMWVDIVPNTRPCYFCILRQKMNGIPILMSAVDPVRALTDEDVNFKRPDCWKGAEPLSRWGLFATPAWTYIAYVDGAYQISFDPLKKVDEIIEDVPLCSMEKVIESIEQRIVTGNIRKIHALRFGYCCYIGKQGETVLYPVWEVECDYFYNPKEESRYDLQGMDYEKSITTSLYYRTMIVNAQTGEFMDPIELKENLLDCPEIITWENVQQ